MAAPKKKKTEYEARLKLVGRVFTATGASISEAIANLEPGTAKGLGVLTIQHGEKVKDRVLRPQMVMRIFQGYGLTHEVALKQASLMFDGI